VTFYGFRHPRGRRLASSIGLNEEINRALQLPEVRSRLEPTGAILAGGTTAEFATFLAANFAKYRKIMAANRRDIAIG